MSVFGLEHAKALEAEMPWHERDVPKTMYQLLSRTRERHGHRPGVSFQLFSGATAAAETLSWSDVHARAIQAANAFRAHGVGPGDAVAYMLPICNEAVICFFAGMIAGIATPINPMLSSEQIGSILRETGAKVLVTLKAFPKTDLAEKAAQAVSLAPNVKCILEVDLNRYLRPPKSWIIPLMRPKTSQTHAAEVHDFYQALNGQAETLSFDDPSDDRVGAYFHTGGTTGMPKVVRLKQSGMIYNGWLGDTLLFENQDTVLCPLPLFHVFAANAILMSMVYSGAHVVFPTPQGYRGDGVFDNFWKLVERWNVSFVATVPTALSVIMRTPINADASTLRSVFSGGAPLPVEHLRQFRDQTGIDVIEGYGLTEASCLVAATPLDGSKKMGSVGIPMPYTDIRIVTEDGSGVRDCHDDEIGEVCIASPGVVAGQTYTDASRNAGTTYFDTYLRTEDLGRRDRDGHLFLTGRSKDIIRGGHNIDPAMIEDALIKHPKVALAGAIGQPDSYAGEVPCAYVELIAGATLSADELIEHCKCHVAERAAHPKYVEVVEALPKTIVGKIFKPDLRKSAIERVFNATLEDAGLSCRVVRVDEDVKLGLVAKVALHDTPSQIVKEVLGCFSIPWEEAAP